MKAVIQNTYSLKRHVLLMIGLCLTCYFAYHLVFGERSYLKLKQLSYQVEDFQEQYKEVRVQRMQLENNVVRLRPLSLDLDLLEERSRVVLGYVDPGEQIILQDTKS